MTYLRGLMTEVHQVVWLNRGWMAWNLILAFIPAGLAAVLLWRPHRRTVLWWMGIGVFVLFLPNAPYVITDLIHLRWSASFANSDSVVVFGVLPLYALFVTLGFTSYLFCVELIVREVRDVRPKTARLTIELPVHAICSVGIVLGRIARLNSWDTVQDPRWALETTFNTLAWRGAPFAFLAIFVAVWFTSAVLRALYLAAWSAARRAWRALSKRDDDPGVGAEAGTYF